MIENWVLKQEFISGEETHTWSRRQELAVCHQLYGVEAIIAIKMNEKGTQWGRWYLTTINSAKCDINGPRRSVQRFHQHDMASNRACTKRLSLEQNGRAQRRYFSYPPKSGLFHTKSLEASPCPHVQSRLVTNILISMIGCVMYVQCYMISS